MLKGRSVVGPGDAVYRAKIVIGNTTGVAALSCAYYNVRHEDFYIDDKNG